LKAKSRLAAAVRGHRPQAELHHQAEVKSARQSGPSAAAAPTKTAVATSVSVQAAESEIAPVGISRRAVRGFLASMWRSMMARRMRE